MTAIAGYWSFDGDPGAGAHCARMLKAQSIYGPHASDWTEEAGLAIGRALFRTLPEDRHDGQPLVGAGGHLLLVADIRIDNRDDLEAGLGIGGVQARTIADSTLLLLAWERWGEGAFARIVGDYAFALWDSTQRRLILARDPVGARPLHYHRGRGFIAFATMAKGLHALPAIPVAPNAERVAEELALLPDSGPESFFAGVERVEPATYVLLSQEGAQTRRHWNPARTVLKLRGPDDYAEAMREQLDRAVKARLRGAGSSVATHLSAGFDSGAVTSSAALQIAPGRVVAYTAAPREDYDGPAPPNRIGDESPGAAQVAALYPNIEHVILRATGASPLEHLDRHYYLFERPILNICNKVWADAINQAARDRGLGVLLTGTMGNLTISYDGQAMLATLLRTGRWLAWLREGSALLRKTDMRPRGLLAASFGPYLPSSIWARLRRGRDPGLAAHSALRPGRIAPDELEARARARALDLTHRPRGDGLAARLWALRRTDPGNYTLGTLGGWGLDVRDPTADRRLIEFCLSVPEDQYLRGGERKALARRAFAGRLPEETIAGRKKGIQAVDWHEGLTAGRAALAEEIARLGACDVAADTLDLARMRKLTEEWPKTGWETGPVMSAYRLALLRGISSGHFLRKASGGNG